MKVMKSYEEIADFIGCKYWKVLEADNRYIGRNYIVINEVELFKHVKDGELHYVKVNIGDDADCKEYMMTYELKDYIWKVYVDDIEEWQKCKVIDIKNNMMGITRATVICESGTQLNRRVKFVLDEEDEEFKADRCIYFYEKIEGEE